MEIFITNDDGYKAKGIQTLARIMSKFGHVTVIAPKTHQSGMSMAVSLGLKPLAFKKLESDGNIDWAYLDATPTSCVKFAFNTIYLERKPDVVVSGINHGSNAASASCYSGTLGATQEAALLGIPAIGVSLNNIRPDADFAAVEKYFPGIFEKLMQSMPESGKGVYYNVNFPNIPAEQIKGVRVARQGMGIWIKEFIPWNPELIRKYGFTDEMFGGSVNVKAEEGEEIYMMVGQFTDGVQKDDRADHKLMEQGFVSVSAHNIDTSDEAEIERLKSLDIDINY